METFTPQNLDQQQAPRDSGEYGRGQALAEALRAEGIEFSYQNLGEVSPDGSYEGVFVLHHQPPEADAPAEPTVRLYRGISHLDQGTLHQVPYALKARDAHDTITAIDDAQLHESLSLFLQDPSYNNLRAYTDLLEAHATPEGKEKMEQRLRKIEHEVLKGFSLRDELIGAHIDSRVGQGDVDVSPFIPTSQLASNAERFGAKAVLVLDVPVSQIAGWGEEDEVLVTGELAPTAISAVAIKGGENVFYGMDKITDQLPAPPVYSLPAEQQLGEYKRWRRFEPDPRDVDQVATARIERLLASLPESIQAQAHTPEANLAGYKQLQQELFDVMIAAESALNGRDYQVDDPEYPTDLMARPQDRKPRTYSRENVTDTMLATMLRHYDYTQQ